MKHQLLIGFQPDLLVNSYGAPQHEVAIKDNLLTVLLQAMNRRYQGTLVFIDIVNLTGHCPTCQPSLLSNQLACSCVPHAKTLANRFENKGLSYRVDSGYEQCHFFPFRPITFFSSFAYSLASKYRNDCGGTKLSITSDGAKLFGGLKTRPSNTATPLDFPAK